MVTFGNGDDGARSTVNSNEAGEAGAGRHDGSRATGAAVSWLQQGVRRAQDTGLWPHALCELYQYAAAGWDRAVSRV